jgi:hypothetical protein
MSQNGGAWVAPTVFEPSGTGYIPVPETPARC